MFVTREGRTGALGGVQGRGSPVRDPGTPQRRAGRGAGPGRHQAATAPSTLAQGENRHLRPAAPTHGWPWARLLLTGPVPASRGPHYRSDPGRRRCPLRGPDVWPGRQISPPRRRASTSSCLWPREHRGSHRGGAGGGWGGLGAWVGWGGGLGAGLGPGWGRGWGWGRGLRPAPPPGSPSRLILRMVWLPVCRRETTRANWP